MIKRLLHKKCSSRFALNVLEWLPLRSSHIQRKNYFKFRGQKRLRAFLTPIFTGGVVEENCRPTVAPPPREKVNRENPQIFPIYI